MSPRAAFAVAVFAALAAAPRASAGAYVCNLPRSLLCEDCARGLTITLTPNGACRVSFTPGSWAPPNATALPLRFEVSAPQVRLRRPMRLARKPAPASGPGHNCFAFNNNEYCE